MCNALVGCLLMPHPAVGFVAFVWMAVLTTLWARIPTIVFMRVLFAEVTFLLVSVIGITMSIQLSPPSDALFAWSAVGMWVSVSAESFELALMTFARALGCATALNFLILTTPLVDIIELIRRIRIPDVLIEIMVLLYRSIFVLLDSLIRIATAQNARLGYHNMWSGFRSSAMLGSQLFLVAYRRSQRMRVALESRGLDGPICVVASRYTKDNRVWVLNIALTVSLCAAWFLL